MNGDTMLYGQNLPTDSKHRNRERQKGQISIFFSTTVIVMITFIAFIVNIGIFVKAKINLQNAADASAYAGASVQARQLTNIAYLNWEMRNIYKEWMFKYYVLGGLNLEGVVSPPGARPPSMDFTMKTFARTSNPAEDRYNFPSTCIDFSSTGGVGLCTKYLVPGLPRFASSNVLGMDETTNAFIDTIVSEKSTNCSERTRLNFLTANTWAFNVLTGDDSVRNIQSEAPSIGTDRMGAFPQAFEIALRMRNLEAQVNFAPVNGICKDPGVGVNCQTTDLALNSPAHVRTVKAFLSGWRNISAADEDMKKSFTIKEVSPILDSSIKGVNSLSTLLIPDGSPAFDKYYLDLKLMTVNYAPFYTAFTTTQANSGGDGTLNVDGQRIDSEGQCAATKIGLPVPGYPMGFVKNPDILTYYAIEARAKFIGLFNPFAGDDGHVLTAYAAAKPFGGRIGPMLFDVSDGKIVKSRSAENRLSSAYISGLGITRFVDSFGNEVPAGEYAPGMPVPINIDEDTNRFWIKNTTDPIGGVVGSGANIFFGIPNLLWDYPTGIQTNNSEYYAGESNSVQLLGLNNPLVSNKAGGALGTTPQAGLYNRDMFTRFSRLLEGINSTVNVTNISNALQVVRAPTLYETHNYLIPTPERLNKELKVDSWGAILGEPNPAGLAAGSQNFDLYPFQLYAPIFSGDPTVAIYRNDQVLLQVLSDYLTLQEPAILKYKGSMNLVAASIFNNNKSNQTGTNTGEQAAVQLSDLTTSEFEQLGAGTQPPQDPKPSCDSITGKFIFYLSGNTDLVKNTDACGEPLKELLRVRWANGALTGDLYNQFSYAHPQNLKKQLFSAYRPGPLHDAGQSNGEFKPATSSGSKDVMIRNFYSTKFIPMLSVTSSGRAAYRQGTMPINSEGEPNESNASNTARKSFSNPIQDGELFKGFDQLNH